MNKINKSQRPIYSSGFSFPGVSGLPTQELLQVSEVVDELPNKSNRTLIIVTLLPESGLIKKTSVSIFNVIWQEMIDDYYLNGSSARMLTTDHLVLQKS